MRSHRAERERFFPKAWHLRSSQRAARIHGVLGVIFHLHSHLMQAAFTHAVSITSA